MYLFLIKLNKICLSHISPGYYFIFCYIWFLNVFLETRRIRENHSLVEGKLNNPLAFWRFCQLAGLIFRMAFFILCLCPWIPATLIMPDFCVTLVVGSSQRFYWGQRFPDIPLLLLETKGLIIELNLGLRTMKISQNGRKLGDIQFFQLLVSQTFVVIPGNGVYPGNWNSKGKTNTQTSEKHVKGICGNRALGWIKARMRTIQGAHLPSRDVQLSASIEVVPRVVCPEPLEDQRNIAL